MRNVKLTVAIVAATMLSVGAAADKGGQDTVSTEVSQAQEANSESLIKKLIDHLRATDRGGSP